MPASSHDLSHLSSLIGAALGQSDKLGADTEAISGHLRAALDGARDLQAGADRPDEGLRPEELTTANDK